MVRLSPEGIVNFSLILSNPFRVMIINNWMMLIAGSYYTPLDHMYMNVTLEILEIDKTAQANLISIQNIHDTFDYSAAPFSRVHS